MQARSLGEGSQGLTISGEVEAWGKAGPYLKSPGKWVARRDRARDLPVGYFLLPALLCCLQQWQTGCAELPSKPGQQAALSIRPLCPSGPFSDRTLKH